MNGPRRLVDGGASDFEQGLLRAGRSLRPSPQARRRTLKAVVAGVGAIGAATGGGSTVMASVGVSALLKWGTAGVLATALAVTGARELRHAAPPAPAAVGAAPAARAITTSVVTHAQAPEPAEPRTNEPAPEEAASPPSEAVVPAPPPADPRPRTVLPSSPPRAREPVAAAEQPIAAAASPGQTPAPDGAPQAAAGFPGTPSGAPAAATIDAKTLADEVASLDRARRALDAKDPNAALRALEDRDRRHGAGRMAPEATLLRIQALVRKGDHAAAEALARSYLAADPNGPYAGRIRAAVAPAKKSTTGQ